MTRSTPAPNQYLKTKVLTASPAELRLLLLDGALRFARQGREGLAQKDYEASYEGISRCQQFVLELISALRPSVAPELCSRLSGLYTFLFTRLMAASSEKDPQILDEVIGLLEYERETWVMAMDRLSREAAPAAREASAAEAGRSGVRLSVRG